jgi:hypothetical protein
MDLLEYIQTRPLSSCTQLFPNLKLKDIKKISSTLIGLKDWACFSFFLRKPCMKSASYE